MNGSVSTWIKQLADGDESAAVPLHKRFWKRLNLRTKNLVRKTGVVTLDYEDVTQRVFSDLLMDIMSGQAKQVVNRRMLWRMFEKMTHARTIDVRRREEAKKRTRTENCGDFSGVASDPHRNRILAVFEEELERLSQLVDSEARSIIDLLRQGFSVDEIAAQFEVSPRTVHRKLAAIKDVFHESAK